MLAVWRAVIKKSRQLSIDVTLVTDLKLSGMRTLAQTS